MLLTLDSNAFGVTKSTKDTRSARRKIIVRQLYGKGFPVLSFLRVRPILFRFESPQRCFSRSVFFVHLPCPFVFFVTLAGLPDRSKRESHEGAGEHEVCLLLCCAELKSGLS